MLGRKVSFPCVFITKIQTINLEGKSYVTIGVLPTHDVESKTILCQQIIPERIANQPIDKLSEFDAERVRTGNLTRAKLYLFKRVTVPENLLHQKVPGCGELINLRGRIIEGTDGRAFVVVESIE